jgi:hypothetical protein
METLDPWVEAEYKGQEDAPAVNDVCIGGCCKQIMWLIFEEMTWIG